MAKKKIKLITNVNLKLGRKNRPLFEWISRYVHKHDLMVAQAMERAFDALIEKEAQESK